MSEKGRQLDLMSASHSQRTDQESPRSHFLGIHFACCDVYSRVYTNRDQTAYVGHCPRCAKRVELKIGSGGTDRRFFTAS